MRGKGFTQLEMMVVLAIAALLLTVAPPLLSNLGSGAKLRSVAQQLVAGLRTVRTEAILNQRSEALTLELKAHRFIADGRSVSLSDKIHLALYTTQSGQLDDDTGQIRFFPDGSSTGGHIKLSRKNRELFVQVDWLTGRVWVTDEQSVD